MVNNFQREGSESNSHVGSAFELEAQRYFLQEKGIDLQRPHHVQVGFAGKEEKERGFDLGSDNPPVLVECKSHTWTKSGNVPSAKMTVWNEAMFFFSLAPERYSKILFVLCHFNARRDKTLAQYYVERYRHLIPDGVEIWEFDGSKHEVKWPSND